MRRQISAAFFSPILKPLLIHNSHVFGFRRCGNDVATAKKARRIIDGYCYRGRPLSDNGNINASGHAIHLVIGQRDRLGCRGNANAPQQGHTNECTKNL
jgi:hypothetical protein